MHPSKLNRVNAAQNHLAGSVFLANAGVIAETGSASSKAEGNSAQGPPALYAQPDILSRGKFSKSHLYNLMARGHFPKPALRMGPRFTRWSAEEVDGWFADPTGYVASHAGGGATA